MGLKPGLELDFSGEYSTCCPTGTYLSTLPPSRRLQDHMAMGDIHLVPIHIVPIYGAPNADMTTVQTTQSGAAGAIGAAERLPCVHLNHMLMNFATCYLTI